MATIEAGRQVRLIVVALDLEAGSGPVLARAVQLATASGARLVAVHVIEADALSEFAQTLGRSDADLRDQVRQQAAARLDQLCAENDRFRRTEVRVEFGVPYEAIARVVDERSADLLVIGANKDLAPRARILGSTADRLVRTWRGSILVVKRAAAAPYRRVAVGVDFSPPSAAAIQAARRVAADASLELVHVTDIPLGFQQQLARAGTSLADIEKYRRAKAASLADELSRFARASVGTEVAICVLEGDPGTSLARYDTDLVVVGPNGRGLVLQAVLGSVTRRVLRDAVGDVLVAGMDR
jgi:nucleotide-binding universal stress UspA family protein